MGNIIFKERNLKKEFFKQNVCFAVELQNPEDSPAFNQFFRELGEIFYLETTLYDATFCKYDEITNLRTDITIYLDDNGQTFYNQVPVNLVPVTTHALKSGAEAEKPKLVLEDVAKDREDEKPKVVLKDEASSAKVVAKEQQQTAEGNPTSVLGGKKTKKLRRFLKTRRCKIKK